MIYLITFLLALAAATILPLSSEATLLYYIHLGYNSWILFIVASIGNILGSTINYYIGNKGVEYLHKHKKISDIRLAKSEAMFNRYGAYTLLLSWVPLIGDPLTLVAGALKFNFIKFIIIVSIAKLGRYFILIMSYLYFR